LKESQDKRGRASNDEVAASKIYDRNQYLIKSSRINASRLLRRKAVKITFATFLALFILVGLSLLANAKDHGLIVEGVKVSGVDVSNLSEEQAKETMNREIQVLLDQTLKFDLGQNSHEVKLGELGLIVTADQALQQAYDYGRTDSIYKRAIRKISASKEVDLELAHKWNEEVLTDAINKKFDNYNLLAADASFQITPQNTMIISDEKAGKVINTEKLIQNISGIDIFKPLPAIKVEFKDQIPQLTAAQLESQKITGLLSSYTTRFDPSQTARSENVRIAAKAFDGAIIKPDEILSFNQIVGKRTIEGGYKDAFIIVNGQFVPGLAGGICQVSSTLYNTGLLANLSVAQRSNHDLAISYAPLGQDATVAYPDLDLKFLNNSGGYLLVRSKVSNNAITIELHGKVTPGQEVFITNSIASNIPFLEERHVDETLAPGASKVTQEGQPGYIVNSTRTIKVNGKVIKTEPLKQSRYQPLTRIIAIGS